MSERFEFPRDSLWRTKKERCLECPHDTRPEALRWQGKSYRVPKVLLSGDHGAIASWREGRKK
ncbi:MAG: hypothetical protein A3A44_00035 [Candidatus Sungbacteria bacterium RIFCSPLOWO2_01_FULL_60_25]|uniref:tRNA methyltransferase TRMD/TRM10-type domain-containing protein n=1 Tax=Candidatus Sungbacteria bacterium RIFCSPLOWO2_01_FULL_60_25 TaxID=1802281 RepID=A0A1G2LBC1_9BACT|nr:MAG: hypothetical protein A3A44_00035 [Candidatus Sungbacteria bacterium RIFCSPLOWO2_01_FULL_60_25]